MTDQLFVFSCRDVRKYAFDFRRGEMHDAEKRKFSEHVAACEKCRDYVDRLEGMLDAAATHDFAEGIDRDRMFERVVEVARDHASEDEVDEVAHDAETVDERLDRDALFDRITAEITTEEEVDDAADDPRPVVELGQYQGDDEDSDETVADRPSRVPLYVMVALAAGIAIGLALPLLDREATAPPPPQKIATDEAEERVDESPSEVESARVQLADLSLQPTPSDVDDVKVFGEPRANWSIRTQGVRRQLELKSGTVLVEFVPRENHELQFLSDRFTVRVTGTVFYASAEEGVVGVVTGSVEVETAEGEVVRLVDGQEWADGSGLRQAERQTTEEARLHVDVAEHQLALKEAQVTDQRPPPTPKPPRKRVEAPRPPMSKEVVETPSDDLRSSADRALREGRYAVAAQYYERMVEEFSAADPANASLRLDLARIYIRHLREPGRAMVHLRRFVNDRPDDPATPSAREELCRIVEKTGATEPLCAP